MKIVRGVLLVVLLALPALAQEEPVDARVLIKSTSPKSVVVLVQTLPAHGRLNKAFRARADDPFAESASYALEKAQVLVTDNEVRITSDAEKLVVALTTAEHKPAAAPAGYKLLAFSGYEVARELGPFTDDMPKSVDGVAELAKVIFGD